MLQLIETQVNGGSNVGIDKQTLKIQMQIGDDLRRGPFIMINRSRHSFDSSYWIQDMATLLTMMEICVMNNNKLKTTFKIHN